MIVDGERYDALDEWTADVLLRDPLPEHSDALTDEMVPYQRTPTRVVLALADYLGTNRDGVFYDIGGGVGELAILIHLLTGMTAKAIEIEPAFCAYGSRLIAGLNLRSVEVINCDAREAGLSDGTVFFMYTPFRGGILTTVIGRLREIAARRTITIATLGPCTLQVNSETWLRPAIDGPIDAKHLAIFTTTC